MKKVCFFMNSPFTLGGEQRVVTTLANYLVQQNYEVSFLLTDRHKKIDYSLYQLNKKIKIQFLDSYNCFWNRITRKIYKIICKWNSKYGFLKHNVRFLKSMHCNFLDKKILVQTITKNSYDFIIGVASEYFSILAVLKPNLKNIKVIAWQHSTFASYFQTKAHRLYYQNSFISYLFSHIDFYVVQTKDDQLQMKKEFHFTPQVIPNPNSFCSTLVSDLTKPNFLAVGRYTFVKGFDKLIEAFSIFSKTNDTWNLYIVGEGEEKENYQKLIANYHLQNRIFLTEKTNDVSKYYLNSSLYVMTSLWEGWGMVVTEAMSFGLPVISFDLPSITEIFENKRCGILVEKNNVTQLADAMHFLAENEDIRKEMSEIVKKQVKKFSIENVGQLWKIIFDGKET